MVLYRGREPRIILLLPLIFFLHTGGGEGIKFLIKKLTPLHVTSMREVRSSFLLQICKAACCFSCKTVKMDG